MRADYKKVTQVVNFLLSHYGDVGLPKLKLVKLVWAADRYHVRKYARFVTGDDYVAMKNGPVPSCVKDVIEFSVNEYSNLKNDDLPYINQYIKNNNGVIYSVGKTDMDYLSDTDVEALNFSLKQFGELDDEEIVDETHKYPEWIKQKDSLMPPIGHGVEKAKDIDEKDFYENPAIEDDPFAVDENELECSKKNFLEYA